jgi:hypothetical protein
MVLRTKKANLCHLCIESSEHKFKGSLKINTDLNRTLVSFQANKKLPFYRWFKYKEGFSAPMMNYLISDPA